MVVGIIAEYNPFHNGHKLQIDYAKNVLHADAVVIAMSGSFTQRGEIACYDKYTRAHAALVSGADIVFEIPSIFATASAREFASAGVQLLANTGVVDTLLFSAEINDESLFISSAKRLIELEASGALDEEIKQLMAIGETYAAARAKAASHHISEEIISSPNNILGVEYCRYVLEKKLSLNIKVMKRQFSSYNDSSLTGEISSATAIRNELASSKKITAVPQETISIYNSSIYVNCNDISDILHYKLLSESNYSKYLDCSFDLADRIKNHLKEYKSFSSFCGELKTKNINYSRVSRVLCHILLNITKEEFEAEKESGYIKYLRMLGFSKKGALLLGSIKRNSSCPLITSPNEDINARDIFASDLFRLVITDKTGEFYPNEYTRKFSLTNIDN